MEIVSAIAQVRELVGEARQGGKRIGFVPTMGALHKGHASLIEAARGQCDFVVVSIFVNPTQFGPGEDFEKYPRTLDADAGVCEKLGVDLTFAPSAKEMYPSEQLTWVEVEKLTEPLCGASRPGHFRGVATVCAKLFNIVQPDKAYFGQKDAQQAVVIKRMVADSNMPLEIVVCPTVREADGVAMSSRNQYLSAEERKDAAYLYKSLQKCREMIEGGERRAERILSEMRSVLGRARGIKVEYVSIVDADTLGPVQRVEGPILAAAAVWIGSTRLIDNIIVDIGAE